MVYTTELVTKVSHFSVDRFITITTRFIILISLGFYGVLYPNKKSSAYSICKLSIASGEAIAFAYVNGLKCS